MMVVLSWPWMIFLMREFTLNVPGSNMVLFLRLIWLRNKLVYALAFGSYWIQILLVLMCSLMSLLLRSLHWKVIDNIGTSLKNNERILFAFIVLTQSLGW